MTVERKEQILIIIYTWKKKIKTPWSKDGLIGTSRLKKLVLKHFSPEISKKRTNCIKQQVSGHWLSDEEGQWSLTHKEQMRGALRLPPAHCLNGFQNVVQGGVTQVESGGFPELRTRVWSPEIKVALCSQGGIRERREWHRERILEIYNLQLMCEKKLPKAKE